MDNRSLYCTNERGFVLDRIYFVQQGDRYVVVHKKAQQEGDLLTSPVYAALGKYSTVVF